MCSVDRSSVSSDMSDPFGGSGKVCKVWSSFKFKVEVYIKSIVCLYTFHYLLTLAFDIEVAFCGPYTL